MGFERLVLVSPAHFPHADATARASGADDVLSAVQTVSTLSEAVADCRFVLGTSARLRSLPWPTVDPRSAAERVLAEAESGPVGLVFGPEQSGLSNDHLEQCHALVHIPASDGYSSLNLAMAVQVLCYELRMTQLAGALPTVERETPLARSEDLEHFYRHLQSVLEDSGFLNPQNPRQLMRRLRRLFNRAELDENEINILRGILSAVDPRTAN